MLRPSTSASCEVDSVRRGAARRDVDVARGDLRDVHARDARSRSPMLVAGEFWMVSFVTTLIAAGALTSCSSVLDAVTTTCSS
jgi:hypothetical protein